jgi:hypothetical protein
MTRKLVVAGDRAGEDVFVIHLSLFIAKFCGIVASSKETRE